MSSFGGLKNRFIVLEQDPLNAVVRVPNLIQTFSGFVIVRFEELGNIDLETDDSL